MNKACFSISKNTKRYYIILKLDRQTYYCDLSIINALGIPNDIYEETAKKCKGGYDGKTQTGKFYYFKTKEYTQNFVNWLEQNYETYLLIKKISGN